MAKTYDHEEFNFLIDNGKREIVIRCNTTDTRNGFCHHAYCEGEHTRLSYINRTWESFRYETCLKYAADKFSKAHAAEIREQIQQVAEGKRKKCEEDLARFKELHESLSDNAKGILARSGIEMRSEEDVRFVEGVMGAMKILGV